MSLYIFDVFFFLRFACMHLSMRHVQVVNNYSSKSFRLMAMAVGVIPKVANLDLVSMSQQQIEAQAVDIQLLALLILTNHVRPDSKPTIAELQEGYASLTRCI